MTDTTSLSILPVVTSSEATTRDVLQTPSNSDAEGDVDKKPLNEGSFLDFLEAFNAMPAADNTAPDETLSGGSTLPLANETADIVRMSLMSLPSVSAPLDSSPSHSFETGKQSDPLEGELSGELALSSSINSAALASRLVGLTQVSNAANETAAVDIDSALPDSNEQLAVSLVSATVNDVSPGALAQAAAAAASPLPLTNPAQLSSLTGPGGKNPSAKIVSTAIVSPESAVAVNSSIEISPSAELELSETDVLFAAQVKKVIAEQQSMINTQTTVPGSPVPPNPVAASQFNTLAAQPIMTTEEGSMPVHQATLPNAFGKPEWNQGLAKQMLLMTSQNIRSAELRLNPANLGPIEVRIKMDDDQVSLAFSSRHAAVREAVELAMPRLREMFEESGLNLADTDVSQQSFAEQRNQETANDAEHYGGSFSNQADSVSSVASAEAEETRTVNMGLVDYYI